ncbi:hypothetical protein [Azospirillum largimobile]
MIKNRMLGFALALAIAVGTDVARAEQGGFPIGPFNVPHTVQGIPVIFPATGVLSFQNTPDGLTIQAKVKISLEDLQSKFGAIIDTIPLPKDNCAHFAGDNMVARIWGKTMAAEGNSIVLTANGDVDIWDCRENPVPNSKMEWVVEDVGFGIKTKVPKVVVWPGNPIKNKLATQPVTIRQTAKIDVISATSLRLVPAKPEVMLGGQYAFITRWLLDVFGINLNDKAKQMLDKAISPDTLTAAIPENIRKFNPTIDQASFGTDNGHAAVFAQMTVRVKAAQAIDILKQFPGAAP